MTSKYNSWNYVLIMILIHHRPDENSDDDEATISKQEDTNDKEEGDRLQKESEMSIEELMKTFYSQPPTGDENDGDGAEDGEEGDDDKEENESEEKETPDDNAAQSSGMHEMFCLGINCSRF